MVALEKFGAKTAFEMGVVLALHARRSNLVSLAQKVRAHFAHSHLLNTVKLLWVSAYKGTETFGGYRIIKYHDLMLNVRACSVNT